MKILFHIDEIDKWNMVLANVKNFLKEEPAANVTVVANGGAVKYYLKPDALPADLIEKVDFVACHNSLKGNDISPGQLNPAVRIVKAGVVEIAQKQFDSYAYIRP